jgi:subtilisin family serine protease
MASPVVAGVAAEVLSREPSLSPVNLKKILLSSAHKVESFNGKLVSPGRVDLERALQKREAP